MMIKNADKNADKNDGKNADKNLKCFTANVIASRPGTFVRGHQSHLVQCQL